MKRNSVLLAILFFIVPMLAWGETDAPPPEVSLDGLELLEKGRHREIYRAPAVDWSIYDKIQIDEASVTFRKNWQRDQNRYQPSKIRVSDMDRIRDDMTELFDKVFSKELSEEGGYEITDSPGKSVLRISPHVIDLDIYAPDPRSQPGIQRSYVQTAGRMTLKLHLYDSYTGDLITVFSDHREAPWRGYVQWANTVTNTKEFRWLLQSWAKDLREGLEEAKTKQGKS